MQRDRVFTFRIVWKHGKFSPQTVKILTLAWPLHRNEQYIHRLFGPTYCQDV